LTSLPHAITRPRGAKLTDELFTALRVDDQVEFVRLLRTAHARNPPADYAEDDDWCTLLQAAAMRGLLEAVRALLDRGMCAHDNCTLQDPPLLLAAELGHLEVLQNTFFVYHNKFLVINPSEIKLV
jgi:hypothetical protein